MSDLKVRASSDTGEDFWQLHGGEDKWRIKLPKLPAYPFPLPNDIINSHFKRIKMTSSGGSILGNLPAIDTKSSDFFQAPESVRYGTGSVSDLGAPPRDGLYRQSSITMWREVLPKREKSPIKTVYLEFYNRSIENRFSLTNLDESIKIYGLNAGITF